MRKIQPGQVIAFIGLLGAAVALAALVSFAAFGLLTPVGEFRAMAVCLVFLITLYAAAISIFRVFMRIRPLPVGDIEAGSPAEFAYHVYLLFYLLLFYPVMKSNLVPVPLMRAIYIALGARLGENTYSGGIIFDPLFVNVGSNTLIGQGALLIPHVIEGERLAHFPIRIGNNVTIGANAVVLSDVEIDDNATIAVGAVVAKGARIGRGEIWGGLPAKCLRGREDA